MQIAYVSIFGWSGWLPVEEKKKKKSCGEITTLPSCNQTAPVASQTTSTTDT